MSRLGAAVKRGLLAAAVAAALGPGAGAAHAQAVSHGSEARADDDWPVRGRFGIAHVLRDVAGRDTAGNAPPWELGPQYTITRKLSVGGEAEHVEPLLFDAHPDAQPYRFGLRIGF